eukprot:2891083-Alexandrium_andersonii.AAC.1
MEGGLPAFGTAVQSQCEVVLGPCCCRDGPSEAAVGGAEAPALGAWLRETAVARLRRLARAAAR